MTVTVTQARDGHVCAPLLMRYSCTLPEGYTCITAFMLRIHTFTCPIPGSQEKVAKRNTRKREVCIAFHHRYRLHNRARVPQPQPQVFRALVTVTVAISGERIIKKEEGQ